VIDSINLSTEYEQLMQQPWINGGMRVKIEQIKDLLDSAAADLVGVDHAPGRTGQGAVHPQGLGHPGAARRACAAGPRRGRTWICCACVD
jgi:hypothetical protein